MKKLFIFFLTLATIFTIAGCKKKNKYITPDVEGNLLDNGNFNYGEVELASSGDQLIKTESGGEWWCYALNGGYGQIAINKKRQLEVGIVMTSNDMHCVQFAYDGFSITKGSKYCLEFDAMCDIDRSMEIRIQQNGGTYENYILEGKGGHLIDKLGTSMKHYKYEFTSAVTDAAPRLAINLGWFEGEPKYTEIETKFNPKTGLAEYVSQEIITLDNFVLTCTYDSGIVIDPLDLASRPNIRLNQLGFKTNQTKQAVLRGDIATMPLRVNIVDANTNEAVMKNVVVKTFGTNKSSLEYLGIVDFTSLETEGTYKIVAGELGESQAFTISDNVYDNITEDAIMMLYRQRCGAVLGESGDKFAHAACHQELATVYGTSNKIDVSGGWHDAGDYGKYVVPGAQTVADLLSVYYFGYGDSFTYPSYVTGTDSSIPDILEEAMWELDWMLKMQNADGQVYHKVSTKEFPTNNVKPQDDHGELFVSPVSYAATADFAAVMAMAANLLNDDSIAPEKAAIYEEAAKKAYAALATTTMKKESFKNPSDIKTGEYPDSELNDELAWASIELYGLTGEDSYYNAFKANFDKTYDLGLGWANVNGFAAIESIGYLMGGSTPITDAEFKEILDSILDYADELVANAKADAYNVTVGTKKDADGNEVYAFEWGSNLTVASNGRILQTAAMIIDSFGDSLGLTSEQCKEKYDEYVKYKETQLNYLLGQNACAYCFVTGYGELKPENPHHRPSVAAGEAMKGMLVGGPDSNFAENGADSVATRSCANAAPAHCYIDNDNSWSTNEITIYWNSPLIYLLCTI